MQEFLSPAYLTAVQMLYIHDFLKIIVISENKNLVNATFKIVPPVLKRFNNG